MGRLFVDPLRSCIVISYGIPDRAVSSDAVIISDVQYRGVALQATTLEFPVRFPVLPADVRLMWETHCLQFGPWRIARCDPRHPAFAPSSRTSLCLTIWNDAAPQSADWVVVELACHQTAGFGLSAAPRGRYIGVIVAASRRGSQYLPRGSCHCDLHAYPPSLLTRCFAPQSRL